MKKLKNNWILWRWLGQKTFSKSFVQDQVKTSKGTLYELADHDRHTNYPTRVLHSEIEIITCD